MTDPTPVSSPGIAEVALKGLCPRCGQPLLFAGWVKFADRCSGCGLDFSRFNVGDGPAVDKAGLADDAAQRQLLRCCEDQRAPCVRRHGAAMQTDRLPVIEYLLALRVDGEFEGLHDQAEARLAVRRQESLADEKVDPRLDTSLSSGQASE